ncbi:MAG: AAA family ATPase, partial [Bacteroidota bacterium]
MKEFGGKEYDDFVYLNFEQDPNLHPFFKGKLDPENLVLELSLYLGKRIVPHSCLIFFDEIQALPEAVTSLKYFQELAVDYHIVAAGSLLGVSLGRESSFPVGKVNFLTLYPLNFQE